MVTSLSVIGLGYIGLPTAAVFADHGLQVYGADVNAEAVKKINDGIPHFGEPDLDVVVKRAVDRGFLKASVTPQPADAYIIAVPTPFTEDKKPDLSYVLSAARNIAPLLKAGDLVIIESTIFPGATEQTANLIAELRPDLMTEGKGGERQSELLFAHCPERVLPGKILHEIVYNDRVIGGMTGKAGQKAAELYKIICKGERHITTARTAETVKLVENSFRDVNIAFANELSLICDKIQINVWDTIRLANLHPRVNILSPGPGVGGHCIAVDPWFLYAAAPEEARLVKTAREVNDSKPDFVVRKVKEAAEKLKDPVILCLGLAFKADVDDMRESPSVIVTKKIAEAGIGTVLAADPYAEVLPKELQNSQVTLIDTETGLQKADILVLLTDHKSFKNIPREILMKNIVIDTRGVWA